MVLLRGAGLEAPRSVVTGRAGRVRRRRDTRAAQWHADPFRLGLRDRFHGWVQAAFGDPRHPS